ncbi:MAG: hypothetical protein KME43_07530 [Myxacorys chilensis ATA2-1-KO14]|jgi:hypothetical protein|nr:hypothetical protein [Myxacorys chilensis ATA2-1-KO14]
MLEMRSLNIFFSGSQGTLNSIELELEDRVFYKLVIVYLTNRYETGAMTDSHTKA